VALGALVLIIVAAAAFGAGAFRSDWRALLDRPRLLPAAPISRGVAGEGPSLPRRGETALMRARALVSAGRLRDALVALDLVRPTDAQKPEAERLRAEIQKQLIALVATSPGNGPSAKGDAPEP
jgi:hypothetical protein